MDSSSKNVKIKVVCLTEMKNLKKQFFEYIIQFRYLIIIIKFKKQDLKQDYC